MNNSYLIINELQNSFGWDTTYRIVITEISVALVRYISQANG